VADRTRKARTNAIADTARGVVELGVLAWYLASGLPVVGAYAAVVVIQLGGCVANPSRRALVPDLVTGDELTAANGVVGNSNFAVSILGPVVATALLAVGGLGAFFAFDAATCVVSAVSMWILSRWLRESRRLRDQHEQRDQKARDGARPPGRNRRTPPSTPAPLASHSDPVLSITDEAPAEPFPPYAAASAAAPRASSVPISPGTQQLSVSVTVVHAMP
jgi:Na+/melibiose symporter-like transporter